MDENKILSKESLINDLVYLRNTIAHGESKDIDFETYNSFYSEVIQLMENIKTENVERKCQISFLAISWAIISTAFSMSSFAVNFFLVVYFLK